MSRSALCTPLLITGLLTACAGDAAAQGGAPSTFERLDGQPSSDPPVVNLRVDEAIARALERNLDIAVERLNPQTFDLSLAQIRATYSPTLTSVIGQRSQVNPPTSQLNGGQRVENDTTTYNAGLFQSLPWGGGDLSVSWNNARNETSNLFANFNPSYNTNFLASYTQPLLRGFRIDNTRQQLLVTRINRDISELQLEATIANTLAEVRNAYWDLLFATEAVAVARQSLELADKLVEDNRTRVEVGAMAPIDVVQAEAEAATRRQLLAEIQATRRTAELALKRLIVDGTGDPLWGATLVPADRPTFQPQPLDLDAAVSEALSRRTDLREARRQLEGNDVTLRYIRNQALPSLDVVATYGLSGLGGTQAIRNNAVIGSPIVGSIPGGFSDAVNALVDRDFPTWNVSLNVSYPLWGNPADAQYARARVQMSQTQAQLKALELQVAAEVTNAAVQVQSNLTRVEAATAARTLAEQRLEAEESKFEVGMSTNFFVVQAQRDLADAQNAELRAELDYRKSLVTFERAQESSLQGAGITTISAGGATAGFGGGVSDTITGGPR